MFSEKIQEARKRLGLTQEELAEQIGVSRQALAKWESFPISNAQPRFPGFSEFRLRNLFRIQVRSRIRVRREASTCSELPK